MNEVLLICDENPLWTHDSLIFLNHELMMWVGIRSMRIDYVCVELVNESLRIPPRTDVTPHFPNGYVQV